MTVVVGIDPSTRAHSAAVLHDTGVDVHTLPVDPKARLRGAQRLFAHMGMLDRWLSDLAITIDGRHGHGPDLIAVELPKGKFVPHQSLQVMGVLLACLADHFACPILELTPDQWAKPTVGTGKPGKPMIMDWARRAHGYQGALQDEADAIAIAAAGWLLLERDERAAA